MAPAAEGNKDYSSGPCQPALETPLNIATAVRSSEIAAEAAKMVAEHYPVAAGDIHGEDCHCERAHLYIQVDLDQVVEVAVDSTYYS